MGGKPRILMRSNEKRLGSRRAARRALREKGSAESQFSSESIITFSDLDDKKCRFHISAGWAQSISLEGNMETRETVVLCPNCRWSARGADEQALSEAKDFHAMYECPLPSSANAHSVDALAS